MPSLIGGEIRVNESALGGFASIGGGWDISQTADGGFVVVWANISLSGRQFDANGTAVGTDDIIFYGSVSYATGGIPTGVFDYFIQPSLTLLSNGTIVVAVTELRSDLPADADDRNYTAVLSVPTSADGIGDATRIYTEGFAIWSGPIVAYGSPYIVPLVSGGMTVVYDQIGTAPGDGYETVGITTVSSGANGGGRIVTSHAADDPVLIASFSPISYLLVSHPSYGQATFQWMYAGLPAGSGFSITFDPLVASETTTNNANWGPGYLFAEGPNNTYVIAWREPSATYDGIVHVQAFNEDGTLRGPEIQTTHAINDVAMLDDGRVVIAWADGPELQLSWQGAFLPGRGMDVYVQIYELEGFASGPAVRVNTTTNYNQAAPDIEALDGNRFVVLWMDDSNSTPQYSSSNINAQVLQADPLGVQRNGTNAADTLQGGDGNDQLFGNGGADRLVGFSLHDTLDGGAGADTMIGGAGDDTYIVDDVADVVSETAAANGYDWVQSSVSWSLNAHTERLTLTGSANLNGGGNGLANRIDGNSGGNALDGGSGADTMYGGDGDDTYYVDNAGDLTAETSSAHGYDRVQSSVSWTLSSYTERLTLTGSANINGTGNGQANRIDGNAGDNVLSGGIGADTLDGGAGADTMIGGAGDDWFIVDNENDVARENASTDGYDRVFSSANVTLGAYVEWLTLTGSADLSGTGNGQANLLEGNSGRNTLDGGVGADTMIGGAGGDTYYVDNTRDLTTELANEGSDRVFSSVNRTLAANIENLTLTGTANIAGAGNALDNVIKGNSGNNTLNGALGADTLTGGAGRDNFLFNTAFGSGNVDRVTDFNVADDTIMLENGIFTALAATGALNAANFRKGTGATDANDFIIYQASTGALFYDADGNGAGAQVQIAALNPNLALTAQDFVVI